MFFMVICIEMGNSIDIQLFAINIFLIFWVGG
jgi:hypothetical protein